MPSRKEERKSRFFEQRYLAPFGRYEGGRDAEEPAQRILVGRRRQRGQLINLLFTTGRRGAFLITGHRGSGKTTFVNHCIAQYTDAVYRRFLASNVGRRLFWDRLGLLVLIASAVTIALLASELLAYVAERSNEIHFLPAVLMILLGLPLLSLFLIATRSLNLWFRNLLAPAQTKSSIMPVVICTAVLLGLQWIGPVVDPALSVAAIVAALGLLFLISVAVPLLRIPRKPPTAKDEVGWADPSVRTRLSHFRWSWLVLIVWAGWAGLAVEVLLEIKRMGGTELLPAVLLYWAVGLAAGGVGLALRGLHLLGWRGRFDPEKTDRASSITSASFSYVLMAVLLLGSASIGLLLGLPWNKEPWLELIKILLLLGAPLALHLMVVPFLGTDTRPASEPRPWLLTFVRALVILFIGWQLCSPLFLWLYRITADLQNSIDLPPAIAERLPPPPAQLFTSLGGDLLWICGVTLIILMIAVLEYEWIVRPFSAVRDEAFAIPTGGSPSSGSQDSAHQRLEGRSRLLRDLSHQTLFWQVYREWLPVLVVPVNLGFDVLEYRHVIEAMLTGLRDQFRRHFLHWSSIFSLLRSLMLLLVALILALQIGNHFFRVEAPQTQWLQARQFCARSELAPATTKRALWLLCRWGGESTLQAFQLSLFREIEPVESNKDDTLMSKLLNGVTPSYLRVYHLITFGLLLLGGRWLGRRWPLLSYRRLDENITAIIEGLSSSLQEEARFDRSQLTEWVALLTGRERTRLKHTDPLDPRTVEKAFLKILDDIQDSRIYLPFPTGHRLSPPLPEIIFIFDEMDKMGQPVHLPIPAPPEKGSPAKVLSTEPLHDERRRSQALHDLFSDLKSLLSSGKARFMFIGGRNLHDEWLADQTARRPLLTNIFDAEIYLPSLLADPSFHMKLGTGKRIDLLDGIRTYLAAHHERAQELNRAARKKRMRAAAMLWVEEPRRLLFVTGTERPTVPIELFDGETGDRYEEEEVYFNQHLVEFLAYRSLGNPKRLKALLEGFIRHVTTLKIPPEAREETFSCEHTLVFRNQDLFRIQLTSDVFRSLGPVLETRLLIRDDKLIRGVLYLSDFLLKFHRRAFAWSSLGRVDELVHIHRAPDLPQVLDRLVVAWSERYLHPIRNGMFDFRFQSEFARELEYISRRSDQERAAFNFTLDESQALKSTFWRRIQDHEPSASFEFYAGIGELHDFDEEYELARYYFSQAIGLLDKKLRSTVGEGSGEDLMMEVMSATPRGFSIARRRPAWGLLRLRLMLLIALTHERSRSYEQAQAEYRSARTLAASLIKAMLGWDQPESSGTWRDFNDNKPPLKPPDFQSTLKNLKILFQPMFAEAWLNEKLSAAVDTGPALLESALAELREFLPFVRRREFCSPAIPTSPQDIRHSNFALIMAELHNKAGDIYFFKGRQVVSPAKAREWESPRGETRRGGEGYTIHASYHYAIALHEVRRYNHYRRLSSAPRLNLTSAAESPRSWPTIETGNWSDFVYRSATGALLDYGEGLLARVSLLGLSAQALPPIPGVKAAAPDLDAAALPVIVWLDSCGTEKVSLPLDHVFPSLTFGPENCFQDWLGTPRVPLEVEPLISVDKVHTDFERLAAGFSFSLAGAHLLEHNGYAEIAAREHLRVAEMALHLVSWIAALRKLRSAGTKSEWADLFQLSKSHKEPKDWPLLQLDLVQLAEQCLLRSEKLFQRTAGPVQHHPAANWQEVKLPLLGDQIPTVMGTVTCWLGLLAVSAAQSAGDKNQALRHQLVALSARAMLERWNRESPMGPPPPPSAEIFQSRLRHILRWREYPLRNRMLALKILADDLILHSAKDAVRDWQEAQDHIEELILLEARYESPLHFPPLHGGITLTLYHLADKPDGESRTDNAGGNWEARPIDYRDEARRRIEFSQQLCTMRRAYYESIGDLYYLYDDFNDRTIHSNFALQMMGLELTSLLLELLED